MSNSDDGALPGMTVEGLIEALSMQCDGACKRDGRGFSRADAQEGGRLAAMYRAGIPWSPDDAARGMSMLSRYARQAAEAAGGGSKQAARAAERAIRGGLLPLAKPTSESTQPYNLACLSPGGKKAYLWCLAWIDDFKGLAKDLRDLGRLRHGARRIFVKYEEDAEITIAGKRRRAKRWEIDFNGTSQPLIAAIAGRHGFAVDPAVETAVDPDIDRLCRSARAAWLHRGVRDGVRGTWAVFDLAAKNEAFSADMKTKFRGRFRCDPADDWNWFVPLDSYTAPIIREMISRHGFDVSTEIAALWPETVAAKAS